MEIKFNKLAAIRSSLGLSQKQLADKIGMPVQTYNRKENGKFQFKDNEKLRIKELFSEHYHDITIDDIFFWSIRMQNEHFVFKKGRIIMLIEPLTESIYKKETLNIGGPINE